LIRITFYFGAFKESGTEGMLCYKVESSLRIDGKHHYLLISLEDNPLDTFSYAFKSLINWELLLLITGKANS